MSRAATLLVTLGFAFAAGCGGSEESSSPGAAAPAAKRENAAPPTATPSAAAEPAPPHEPPASANPAAAATAGDPARGAPLYVTYCASCHGPKGDGDGPVAATLDPKPAAHSDAAYMDTLSDEHLVLVISKGGPAIGKSPLMAGWAGTLDAGQIVDVVAYIRTLSQ
jgi:mono/diheme cytochrome c family protein